MKLLIADDELIIRRGLESLNWKSIGIDEVVTVSNGLEAKESLMSSAIDLAILDVKIPGMTGLELAELIKEKGMDTAVVFLTGFSEFEYARAALRSDVYEYLLKPLRPREILGTMADVKRRLEEKRYQAQVVKEHKKREVMNFDAVLQITDLFSGVPPVMFDILMTMAKHYDQPLSLGSMSNKYYFSKNSVSRMFRRKTGYSFTDVLTAVRLASAANQLMNGEHVNQVSQQNGFSDQRYFSQVFRKVFDCSPSELKNSGYRREDLTLQAVLHKKAESYGERV